MLVSTILLTLVGWAVTAWFVEPRLGTEHDNQHMTPADTHLDAKAEDRNEKKGLIHAMVAVSIALIITGLLIMIPGAPLHGTGSHFSRWIEATVPLLFILFFVPGIVFGLSTGKIKNDKQVVKMLGDTIAHLGPYIVMAFFAAQFIECFKYTGLGKMLAIIAIKIKPVSNIEASNCIATSHCPPIIANIFPRPVYLKHSMNCAAKNAITM